MDWSKIKWEKETPLSESGYDELVWDKPDTTIQGIFKDIKKEQGKRKNSTIYYVELDTKELKWFWGSTVLDDRFKNCIVGDLFQIKYLGLKPTKDGSVSYKNFEIAHAKLETKSEADNLPTVDNDMTF